MTSFPSRAQAHTHAKSSLLSPNVALPSVSTVVPVHTLRLQSEPLKPGKHSQPSAPQCPLPVQARGHLSVVYWAWNPDTAGNGSIRTLHAWLLLTWSNTRRTAVHHDGVVQAILLGIGLSIGDEHLQTRGLHRRLHDEVLVCDSNDQSCFSIHAPTRNDDVHEHQRCPSSSSERAQAHRWLLHHTRPPSGSGHRP